MAEAASPELPQHLFAVALDTNSMPKGRFALRPLQELAAVIDSQEIEVELWIPEPSVWEWAEHLHRDVASAAEPHRVALKSAVEAGVQASLPPTIDELASPTAVSDALERAIAVVPGVKVLRLADHPRAALDGLRDQVLQLGVGRRKTSGEGKRVKTGAADSAAFRLIQLEAGDALGRVAVITADKDALTFFASEEAEPVLLNSIWAAKKALGALLTGPAADDAAVEAVEAAVAAQLSDSVLLGRASIEVHGEHFEGSAGTDAYLDVQIYATEVTGLFDVREIEIAGRAGFATAEVDVELTLERRAVWYDATSDRLEHDWDHAHDVAATLQVSLENDGRAWSMSIDHVVVY